MWKFQAKNSGINKIIGLHPIITETTWYLLMKKLVYHIEIINSKRSSLWML